MLRMGFSIAQVVHDYGDICQAVTEFAEEMEAPIKMRSSSAVSQVMYRLSPRSVTGACCLMCRTSVVDYRWQIRKDCSRRMHRKDRIKRASDLVSASVARELKRTAVI